MNFKRRKSKKKVKCTLCTAHRWQGNSKQRFAYQALQQLRQASDFVKMEIYGNRLD